MPYAAGELLARVRERGTVELDYRERDVRVPGRVAPSLAGELKASRRALGRVALADEARRPTAGPMTEPAATSRARSAARRDA